MALKDSQMKKLSQLMTLDLRPSPCVSSVPVAVPLSMDPIHRSSMCPTFGSRLVYYLSHGRTERICPTRFPHQMRLIYA